LSTATIGGKALLLHAQNTNMKQTLGIILVFICCSFSALCQPMYSPEERSRKEVQWMKDSLTLSGENLDKISKISLEYFRQMDKAAETKDKDKEQGKLMKQKDKQLKALLNNEQYQKYYRREKEIRRHDKIIYKGPHQPY